LLWRIVRILLCFTCVCCTTLSQAAVPRIAVFRPTLDLRAQARVQAMLSEISGPATMLDLRDDWSSYSLLVLVSPPIPTARHGSELTFSQKLATFYLLGGHVLLVSIPEAMKQPQSAEAETWNGLMHYFWNCDLISANGTLEDSDHRAFFVPSVEALGTLPQFRQSVQQLLSARDDLPEQVPAENFGPVPSVSLRQGSLWIDDKPRLLKSVGYYDLLDEIPMRENGAALRMYQELGFNSVVVIFHYDVDESHLRQFLDLAEQNGIYVQLQVQGPVDSDEPVRKEYLLKALRFRNHPALIGWTMCDDMWDIYFPFIQKAVAIIRRYDHRLPITATSMDERHPEKVQDWAKWTHLMDFPLTYLYPMQKDRATDGRAPDIQGGLKDIQRLMVNTNRLWGDVFAEQFLQAHMQGPLAEQVGLKPWTEHLLPGADQERLITYRALLSGVKGLVYFYPGSLEDEGVGRNRRNELAIVWRELAPVEDILAAGSTPELLATSDQTVDASLIRSGNEGVILAVKDQTYYTRYVDTSRVEGLKVQLPANSPDCPLFQLEWPEPEKLELSHASGARSVELHPFALSTVLLWSCDATRQRGAREAMKNNLPIVAPYALDVLTDEEVKTIVVSRHLPRDLQGDPVLLGDVVSALDGARKASEAGDWTAAWQRARAGIASVQEYRAQAMKAAAADAERRGASDRARVYLNIYFSLPNYAYVTRGGPTIAPGGLRKEILEEEGEPVWESIDRVAH
jgi:hypothetical protein